MKVQLWKGFHLIFRVGSWSIRPSTETTIKLSRTDRIHILEFNQKLTAIRGVLVEEGMLNCGYRALWHICLPFTILHEDNIPSATHWGEKYGPCYRKKKKRLLCVLTCQKVTWWRSAESHLFPPPRTIVSRKWKNNLQFGENIFKSYIS